MTRAQDRLYVCGWQGVKGREDGCWYDLVREALAGRMSETDRPRRASPCGVWISPQAAPAAKPKAEGEAAAAPEAACLGDDARRHRRGRATLLTPSGLGALCRGRAAGVWRAAAARTDGACREPPLLARTPRAYAAAIFARDRPGGARGARPSLRARADRDLPAEMREEIVRESLAIVRRSALRAALRAWQPWRGSHRGAISARSRCSTSQARSTGSRSSTTRCWFSTTRPIGRRRDARGIAPAYIAQLAAYRAGARARCSRAALCGRRIVWTDGPKLMEIPSTLLDAAERRILRGGAPALTLRGCAPRFDQHDKTGSLAGVECRRSRRSKWQLQLFPTTPSRPTCSSPPRRSWSISGPNGAALPADRARARGDRQGAPRQGQDRQAQYRRESSHAVAVQCTRDPDADDLQGRPARGDPDRRAAEKSARRLDQRHRSASPQSNRFRAA